MTWGRNPESESRNPPARAAGLAAADVDPRPRALPRLVAYALILLALAATGGCGGESASANSDRRPSENTAAVTAENRSGSDRQPTPRYPQQDQPDYISFDALSLQHLPEVPNRTDLLPEAVQAYQGRLIQVRGYIYPSERVTGITRFRLCRDNGVCCFGGTPKLWDMIVVYMAQGETIDDPGPLTAVEIQGRLRIEPTEFNGSLVAVYFLDEARVP